MEGTDVGEREGRIEGTDEGRVDDGTGVGRNDGDKVGRFEIKVGFKVGALEHKLHIV